MARAAGASSSSGSPVLTQMHHVAQHEIELPDLQEMESQRPDIENSVKIGEARNPVDGISPFWLLVSLSSHMAWGLFPVFGRYLQHFRGHDGIVVLTICYILALIVEYAILSMMGKVRVKVPDNLKLGLMFFTLCIGRGTSNIICVRYTEAMYAQIVTSFAPFLVTILTKIIYAKDDLPKYIYPTLTACFICAVVVIFSQRAAVSNTEELDNEKIVAKGEKNDLLGISISLVSIFFSAVMRIVMKSSGNAGMPETSLMAWRYLNFVPLLFYIQLVLHEEQATFFRTATVADYFVILAFTFTCVLYADMAQISAVRHLGPALASSFQPLRLMATVFGAWIALGEPPRSILTWLGLIGIVVITTTYIRAQPKGGPKYATPAQFPEEISPERASSPIRVLSSLSIASPSPSKISMEDIKMSGKKLAATALGKIGMVRDPDEDLHDEAHTLRL